jgi:hypothetical protein
MNRIFLNLSSKELGVVEVMLAETKQMQWVVEVSFFKMSDQRKNVKQIEYE